MMRKILLPFLFFISYLTYSQQVKHVILISIDGFRPDFYRETSWPAPTIQYMAQHGVSVDQVRGVFPSVTYPSHTTIITGALPAKHGIFYNTPFDPNGYSQNWYWYEKDIRVNNLWRATNEKGLTTANLFWPVSVGAPVTYSVPEYWNPGDYEGFFEFIKDHDQPDGLIQELETEATGNWNSKTFNGDYLNREGRTGYMAGHLIEKYQPNFMAVHLIGTDHFQHEQGRDGLKFRQSVVAVDYAINQIMESCERAGIYEETAFIITGDHGFVNINTRLAPNNWLERAGLLENKEDRGNWKAAFHSSGAAAFLYLKDPNDTKTLKQVKQILDELPDNIKKLFEVLNREDLNKIGSTTEAHLALNPVEGINFTSRIMENDLMKDSGGTHGYKMDFYDIHTGFIGFGAGFQKGVVAKEIGLEDIAPLISELLQLDFSAPDGVLFPGFLQIGTGE